MFQESLRNTVDPEEVLRQSPPPPVAPGDPAVNPPVEDSKFGLRGAGEWLNETFFEIGGAEITPLNILIAVVIVLLSFQVSRFLQKLIERGLRSIHVESEGTIGTITRLVHYSLVVLGLLIALDQLGIKLQALLTAGAIFAVAFGFAMQNIAQNFVSGVILLLERSIKPGDVLEVDGKIVRVDEMGIRATVVRTLDEEEVIVPNSILVQNTVKNFTLRDNQYRLRTTVGVTYASDMRLVQKTLDDMARELEWRDKSRSPRIHLIEFGDNSVVWEVNVWIRNPWLKQRMGSRLNEAVWWALKDKGVTIAFPQLDLHLDSRVEDLIRKLSPHADEVGT